MPWPALSSCIGYLFLAVICVAANILEAALWARIRVLEEDWCDSERAPVIRPKWEWYEDEWWPDIEDPYAQRR